MVAGVRVRGGGLLVLQAGQLCLRLGDPGLVERRILRTVRAEVDGGPSRRGTVIRRIVALFLCMFGPLPHQTG